MIAPEQVQSHIEKGLQCTRVRVVGEADAGMEALALARTAQPDVVIVEPAVPGGGLKLIAELCREVPRCAILVLTEPTNDDAVGGALKAGARGYLQKSCEPEDLVRTIERVHLGELVVAAHNAPVLNGHGRSQGVSASGRRGVARIHGRSRLTCH